jgi:alpha-beta hydrolase superfamily lysophospholipase
MTSVMPSTARPVPHPDFGTELVRDWEPEGSPRAHLVLVHGLGEHCGRYERMGQQMAEAGLWVRSFDLVGAGGSGGKRWHIEDWATYHDQVQSHVVWAREQGGPLVLMGHSLGGAIALGYLLGDRPQPDLAVLSAPALAGGAAWQRALAPVLAKVAPTATSPTGVKGEHLSRDPAVGEAYFADPLVMTKATFGFGAEAFKEIERLNAELGRLSLPTLVIHGGEDVLVPTSCSEPLGDLDNVERKVYEGLRHETFNEPEGAEVVADIITWIDAHL